MDQLKKIIFFSFLDQFVSFVLYCKIEHVLKWIFLIVLNRYKSKYNKLNFIVGYIQHVQIYYQRIQSLRVSHYSYVGFKIIQKINLGGLIHAHHSYSRCFPVLIIFILKYKSRFFRWKKEFKNRRRKKKNLD